MSAAYLLDRNIKAGDGCEAAKLKSAWQSANFGQCSFIMLEIAHAHRRGEALHATT